MKIHRSKRVRTSVTLLTFTFGLAETVEELKSSEVSIMCCRRLKKSSVDFLLQTISLFIRYNMQVLIDLIVLVEFVAERTSYFCLARKLI